MKQNREIVVSAVAFLIAVTLLSGLYMAMERRSVAQNRERYRSIAASQSNNIRDCIDTVLARAYTLRVMVIDGGGGTDFFERQAERIYQETKIDTGVALKNIALAPAGVVRKVYPAAGNEELLGFDFMDRDKAGNEEAVAAYHRGQLVLTNPFELVQGEAGLAGRLPVFLADKEENGFWGLVTVTMDFQDLMTVIDLAALTNMGANYELWHRDEGGDRVVMSASEHAPEKPVSYEFTIKNLTWHLDVAPAEGWVNLGETAIAVCVIAAVSLMMALLLLNRGQIKKANEELQRLAHLDSLTSCYSRHYVNTVLLNQRKGVWNDPSAKYSLAVIDIDDFKYINDTYGHDTGDRALIAVAQVLTDNGKRADGDCVIRHGGDEFILLYNHLSRERFEKKLNSIVQEVREICFPDCPDLHLTVSIGATCYNGPERSLYYNMVHDADEKLYMAKKNGRDQFVL